MVGAWSAGGFSRGPRLLAPPVTILIDERPDGVHLTYDRMVSFLRPYGNPEALEIAASLDAKMEGLLVAAASSEAPPKSH